MRKNKSISEIFLASKNVSPEAWQKLILLISRYIGILRRWKIIVKIELNEVRYFIETPRDLPTKIGDLPEFLLNKVDNYDNSKYKLGFFYVAAMESSLIDIYDKNEIKYSRKLKEVEISFFTINSNKYISNTKFFFEANNKDLVKRRSIYSIPPSLLSIDFSNHSRFFYKKVPKYLDIQKSLHLLKSDDNNALLKIDTFPYLRGDYYLNQSSFNFDKHSIVIGSSGTGKSKLISLMINNIVTNLDYQLKYKIVVIDPHAALENDIGGLENSAVLNFKTMKESADLFMNSSDDIVASTELILSLFKSLIADQYNSKLERVLRYSLHLLLIKGEFTFLNMRKLITETEHRNALVRGLEDDLPNSVVDFFLTDFNQLKTQSYPEAISPIISFIDEMNLLPVFNKNNKAKSISDVVKENILTVFSLDQTKLGAKVTKTIAGLVMQQVLQMVQAKTFDEHIILVVDEVAVVENPILSRLLSEARKYNLSLVLAQQYFNQISTELRDSIFANVINYYVFRVSRLDATVLEENLKMKVVASYDLSEARINILIGLNDRECIARISSNGLLLPAFKARTVDFKPIPKKVSKELEFGDIEFEEVDVSQKTEKPKFEIDNIISLNELMISQSTSRKKMR